MKKWSFRERAQIKGFAPFVCACILFWVVAAVYAATGENEFAPELCDKALYGWLAAAVVSSILVFRNCKVLTYAVYLCGLYAWLEFLCSQVNYIANVIVAIDGSTFSASFIATTAGGLAAWVLAVISAGRQPSVFREETGKAANKSGKGAEKA